MVILLLLGVAICLLYRGLGAPVRGRLKGIRTWTQLQQMWQVFWCSTGGGNAFVSCLPAALNFGVSSMLLKAGLCLKLSNGTHLAHLRFSSQQALPQVARGLLQAPQRPRTGRGRARSTREAVDARRSAAWRLELWAALPVLGGLILAAGSAQTDPTDPTEALPFGARRWGFVVR